MPTQLMSEWLQNRITEQKFGGWGAEVGVNPLDTPQRVLTIQMPYPTTIAFRFVLEDVNGDPPVAPVTRLRIRRGTSEGWEEFTVPMGTYYFGCADLIADTVPSGNEEDDSEKVRVFAWIPIVHDSGAP